MAIPELKLFNQRGLVKLLVSLLGTIKEGTPVDDDSKLIYELPIEKKKVPLLMVNADDTDLDDSDCFKFGFYSVERGTSYLLTTSPESYEAVRLRIPRGVSGPEHSLPAMDISWHVIDHRKGYTPRLSVTRRDSNVMLRGLLTIPTMIHNIEIPTTCLFRDELKTLYHME